MTKRINLSYFQIVRGLDGRRRIEIRNVRGWALNAFSQTVKRYRVSERDIPDGIIEVIAREADELADKLRKEQEQRNRGYRPRAKRR